jgi:isoamylase
MLLILNAHHEPVEFTLPSGAGGTDWSLLIDTNISEEREEESFEFGHRYTVTPRSFLLFRLQSDDTTQAAGD